MNDITAMSEAEARAALKDKRRSDCSQDEWDVATEHWVRDNIGWESDRIKPVLQSLLNIIDKLRKGEFP